MSQQGAGGPGLPPEHQDFINRYQEGPHAVTGQESLDQHQNVASQVSPEDYRHAAYEAFSRMSPEDRRQFAQQVGLQAQQQGYPFPDVNRDGVDDRYEDPQHLAQATAQMQQQRPGLLGQLFGGSGGSGGPGGPVAGQGLGGLLESPWAKGALAGIAAYGLGRMVFGGGYGGYGGGFFGDNDGGFFGGDGDGGGGDGGDGGGGGDGD
jgi:hypothetical protein